MGVKKGTPASGEGSREEGLVVSTVARSGEVSWVQ